MGLGVSCLVYIEWANGLAIDWAKPNDKWREGAGWSGFPFIIGNPRLLIYILIKNIMIFNWYYKCYYLVI